MQPVGMLPESGMPFTPEMLNVYFFYALLPNVPEIYHKIVFAFSEDMAFETAYMQLEKDLKSTEFKMVIINVYPVSFFTKKQEIGEHHSFMRMVDNTDKMLVVSEINNKINKKKSYANFKHTLNYLVDRHPKWLNKAEKDVLNKLIIKCGNKSRGLCNSKKESKSTSTNSIQIDPRLLKDSEKQQKSKVGMKKM